MVAEREMLLKDTNKNTRNRSTKNVVRWVQGDIPTLPRPLLLSPGGRRGLKGKRGRREDSHP